MFAILPLLMMLLVLAVIHHLWTKGAVIAHRAGEWGAPANSDPRVAVAAMMYAVARAGGSVTAEKTELMVALLTGTIGLTTADAHQCLSNGKRLSRGLTGSLNSQLHQLRGSIERACSAQEKRDVIDMLHSVAGR